VIARSWSTNNYESDLYPGASYGCIVERSIAMKKHFQAVFAALALLFAALAPMSAVAEHSAGTHSHTASYHDRTPVAHTHGSHGGHHHG
jgi:hypothetical protein